MLFGPLSFVSPLPYSTYAAEGTRALRVFTVYGLKRVDSAVQRRLEHARFQESNLMKKLF